MTDRELDGRLRAWYRSAVPATEVAPPALRSAVLAIPRTVVRPPEILSRRRLSLLALAAALSATLLGLLALGPGKAPSQRTPPAPTTPAESAAVALPSAQPSPTPLDTRPEAIPARVDMFGTMGTMLAASDTVAWVKTLEAIYRTDDTGATWRAVQPAGWVADSAPGFADADTAYVATGAGDAISATHDGGSTWLSVHIDGAGGMGTPIFSFRSPSVSFATYVDPGHFDKSDGTGLVVFSTVDGGASWQGPAHGLQPHLEASMNKVAPAIGGFLVSSAGKFDTKAFENWFDLSDDGGRTYTRYDFPTGRLAPKNAGKAVDDVIREADGRLLISVSADGGQTSLRQAVYESGDTAGTWRLVYEEPDIDEDIQFLSESTWVLSSGGAAPSLVRTTADRGITWQDVTVQGRLFASAESRQFATPRTGWATVRCSDVPGDSCGSSFFEQRATRLIVTTDGGATWKEIGR